MHVFLVVGKPIIHIIHIVTIYPCMEVIALHQQGCCASIDRREYFTRISCLGCNQGMMYRSIPREMHFNSYFIMQQMQWHMQ